jgi:hypothetical protein
LIRSHRLLNRKKPVMTTARKKKIRATVAKEVGMKNPAEETTVRPNQIQKIKLEKAEFIRSSFSTRYV